MVSCQPDLRLSGTVRPQLVGHEHGRCKALLLDQLSHELHGCGFVPALLDQDVEHLALLIDSPPEIEPPAADHGYHLVQVPLRAWSRAPGPQPARKHGTKLQNPAA